MTAALSPDQAIAYVRELSADVRASIVLGSDGICLAGEPTLAVPAAAFVAALGDAAEATVRVGGGVVFAARSTEHALVTVAGPLSLEGPTRLDGLTAVAAMGGEMSLLASSATPSADVVVAAEQVISASQQPL